MDLRFALKEDENDPRPGEFETVQELCAEKLDEPMRLLWDRLEEPQRVALEFEKPREANDCERLPRDIMLVRPGMSENPPRELPMPWLEKPLLLREL
jgi:hypothetical protein